MSASFQLGEHLQQELAPEPLARPAAGAVLLHCGIVIAVVLYGVIGGFFRHNLWGGAGPGGARGGAAPGVCGTDGAGRAGAPGSQRRAAEAIR